MEKANRRLLGQIMILLGCALGCTIAIVYAMENPEKDYEFIKMSLSDIQDYARDLSQETGKRYMIVENVDFLKRCLDTLGLTLKNTPLDIRYHHDLLINKLDDDDLIEVFTGMYDQLMQMLFAFDDYHAELQYLVEIDFEEVQELELDDISISKRYKFLKNKDRLIKKTLNALNEHKLQYYFQQTFESSTAIQNFFNLPADAPYHLIETYYNDYMKKNSPDRLIALKKIMKISHQEFKKKMLEVEKVKKAYEQYLSEWRLKRRRSL